MFIKNTHRLRKRAHHLFEHNKINFQTQNETTCYAAAAMHLKYNFKQKFKVLTTHNTYI